jgi:putative intracellular protease/amidase
MQVAFLLYDRFTALDLAGPYEVLASVPGTEAVLVAEQTGPVRNDRDTMAISAERTLDEVTTPDILVVPGGLGTRLLLDHEPVLGWLRRVHKTTTWTTSVCTGSLLLAAAGLLEDAPATTHWVMRETLSELGAVPLADRVVEHGKIMTAAGVSSGIDMALQLVQRIHGDKGAQAVQLGIEYDPEPPFDAGAPEKVSRAIADAVEKVFRSREAEILRAGTAQGGGPRASRRPRLPDRRWSMTFPASKASFMRRGRRGTASPKAARGRPSCSRTASRRPTPAGTGSRPSLRARTAIAPDLRGYGASEAPPGGPRGARFLDAGER